MVTEETGTEKHGLPRGVLKDDPRIPVIRVANLPVDGKTRAKLALRLAEYLCDTRFYRCPPPKSAKETPEAGFFFEHADMSAVRTFEKGARCAAYVRIGPRPSLITSSNLYLVIVGVDANGDGVDVEWRRFGATGTGRWADFYNPDCVTVEDGKYVKKCDVCTRERDVGLEKETKKIAAFGGPDCAIARTPVRCHIDLGTRPGEWEDEKPHQMTPAEKWAIKLGEIFEIFTRIDDDDDDDGEDEEEDSEDDDDDDGE